MCVTLRIVSANSSHRLLSLKCCICVARKDQGLGFVFPATFLVSLRNRPILCGAVASLNAVAKASAYLASRFVQFSNSVWMSLGRHPLGSWGIYQFAFFFSFVVVGTNRSVAICHLVGTQIISCSSCSYRGLVCGAIEERKGDQPLPFCL